MTDETAAAAVAKFRADLPNVICRDLGAAQGAMHVYARDAVVDQNEAEHNGPPLEIRFLVKTGVISSRPLLIEICLDRRLFPDRKLVIGCVRRLPPEAGALGHREAAP
jgi:hypothetical protein